MSQQAYRFALSALDKERFGMTTARVDGITADRVPDILVQCQTNGVELIIARCAATDFETVHVLERSGFLLMDTLVYWTRDLHRTPLPELASDVIIRPARVDEAEQVKALARDAFRGYFGHYHADERLDRTAADEAYASWAERSVLLHDVADVVLVAELNSFTAGLITLRMKNSEEGEGILFAVSPSVQRRSISRPLMVGAMGWCARQGAARMVISTQLVNVASQKVWARLGFELSHAHYTFHKWVDE